MLRSHLPRWFAWRLDPHGRFVSGLSWREMLAEYDLAAGRLWVLVPAWVALAPYVFYRRGRGR